jgi:hypothetical protein
MAFNRTLPARICFAVGLSAALASAAEAWSDEADVGVRVNGHEFHHVSVQGHDCTLTVHVAFDAPDKGYGDPKNTVRNYHRFQARVKLAKGQTVDSPVFSNTTPGAHTFTFDHDTAADGCWVKEPNKVVKLDVIGCRGKGCDLGQFE